MNDNKIKELRKSLKESLSHNWLCKDDCPGCKTLELLDDLEVSYTALVDIFNRTYEALYVMKLEEHKKI